MEKITKSATFAAIAKILEEGGHEEYAKFITAEKERVDKANAKKKATPTKAQAEAAELANKLGEVFPAEKALTVSEAITEIELLKGLTTQKVAPILKTLVENGTLVTETVKRKTYYKRA